MGATAWRGDTSLPGWAPRLRGRGSQSSGASGAGRSARPAAAPRCPGAGRGRRGAGRAAPHRGPSARARTRVRSPAPRRAALPGRPPLCTSGGARGTEADGGPRPEPPSPRRLQPREQCHFFMNESGPALECACHSRRDRGRREVSAGFERLLRRPGGRGRRGGGRGGRISIRIQMKILLPTVGERRPAGAAPGRPAWRGGSAPAHPGWRNR